MASIIYLLPKRTAAPVNYFERNKQKQQSGERFNQNKTMKTYLPINGKHNLWRIFGKATYSYVTHFRIYGWQVCAKMASSWSNILQGSKTTFSCTDECPFACDVYRCDVRLILLTHTVRVLENPIHKQRWMDVSQLVWSTKWPDKFFLLYLCPKISLLSTVWHHSPWFKLA